MKTKIQPSWASCALISLLTLASSFVEAEDRRENQDRLRVMTYNVEFMWDGIAPEEGNADFAWKGDESAASARMEKIADMLRLADADVVHLVEVENEAALKKLNSMLPNMGYEPVFIKGRDSSTGQDVAILSRIDPSLAERWSKKGKSGNVSKSVSKNIRATFETANGFEFGLVGLHLLAWPDDSRRKDLRQAQADAIANSAVDLLVSGPVVVLGDFNDYDGVTFDHQGSQPITTVLSRIREMDRTTPDDDLFNVAGLLATSDRFTAHWDKDKDGQVDAGEHTSIDHILVSESARQLLVGVEIINDQSLDHPSDHYPVVAEFDLGSGNKELSPQEFTKFDNLIIRFEDSAEPMTSSVPNEVALRMLSDYQSQAGVMRYFWTVGDRKIELALDWDSVVSVLRTQGN